MSATDKYVTYRGDVRAIAAAGATLLFVTAHPEGRATALYRWDAEKLALAQDALPAGGLDVVVDGDTVWIAGSDRRIYRGATGGGKVVAVGPELEAAPVAMAVLAEGRLGVVAGAQLVVMTRDGKVAQTLPLPEQGTCVAADRRDGGSSSGRPRASPACWIARRRRSSCWASR
jgi:ParB family chromosome partitioning protein